MTLEPGAPSPAMQPDKLHMLGFTPGMRQLLRAQPGANEFIHSLDDLLSVTDRTAGEVHWAVAEGKFQVGRGIPEFRCFPEQGIPGVSIRLNPTNSSGERILGDNMGGPYFAPFIVSQIKRWEEAHKVRTASVKGEIASAEGKSELYDQTVSFAQKIAELREKDIRLRDLLVGLDDASPVVEIYAAVPRIGSPAAQNEFMIDFKLPANARHQHFAAMMLCGDRLVHPLALNSGEPHWVMGRPTAENAKNRLLAEEQFRFTSRSAMDDLSWLIEGGARAHELIIVLLPHTPPSRSGMYVAPVLKGEGAGTFPDGAVSTGIVGGGAFLQNTWSGKAEKLSRPYLSPPAAIFHLHILEVDPTRASETIAEALRGHLDDTPLPDGLESLGDGQS